MTLGPAIILIIVAAIAGYALGIIDSRMTASIKNNIKSKPEVDNSSNSPEEKKARNIFPGEHTVLRISIDDSLNWHCEIDGSRFDNPSHINIEQIHRAVTVMGQIKSWLGVEIPNSTIVVERNVEQIQPFPVEPSQVIPHISRSAAEGESSTPPKINPMRGLRSILNNEVKSPNEKKGLSIVEMIDEVLQSKLIVSSLSDKNIHLEEGPQGEVIVHIGLERFSGINEVPDPEIQKMIKAAISDWERG